MMANALVQLLLKNPQMAAAMMRALMPGQNPLAIGGVDSGEQQDMRYIEKVVREENKKRKEKK